METLRMGVNLNERKGDSDREKNAETVCVNEHQSTMYSWANVIVRGQVQGLRSSIFGLYNTTRRALYGIKWECVCVFEYGV